MKPRNRIAFVEIHKVLGDIETNTANISGGGGAWTREDITALGDGLRYISDLLAWIGNNCYKTVENLRNMGGGVSPVPFEEGGIAMTETLGLLAEKEPEVVLPLSKINDVFPTSDHSQYYRSGW